MRLEEYREKLVELGITDFTKLHITYNKEILLDKINIQSAAYKPRGLWYSVGFEWLIFVTQEFQFYEDSKELYSYKILTEGLNMLCISNVGELLEFSEKFKENSLSEY